MGSTTKKPEPMMRMLFSLEKDAHKWLLSRAVEMDISAASVLRLLVDAERKRRAK